ncbi:conserved Plasmodium protein, unknown function [Plasmodium vinckei vinckei]|uniref:Uncharacterized protein n=1 Tax=Plasmodium vinckei vinckei TaxID=54757 RepID=A0A449BTA3_PLAVN|nr:conserved Plasmodium protein, unknown function [Plasmodium vinckei vinckei]KEG02379.1 hypothetical protein YYE_03118 [Plasmodium vinckei vinckei]VEV56622.1 conserved Plasmodium protein, unknown function [Plasmodium vinckei vinckei]
MLPAKKIEKADLLGLLFYGQSTKKKQKNKNYYLELNHINKVMKNICNLNKNRIKESILTQTNKEDKTDKKNEREIPGVATTPEVTKENAQKNKYMLKKINGELKELNNLDTSKILKNYIPYTKTNKFNMFTDLTQTNLSYKYDDINNFDNLPTIYQTQNLDTDLVKKCRDASKNVPTDISKHCQCSEKEMKKIKEALNGSLCSNLTNQQNAASKYLIYPREQIQRLSCSNQNEKTKLNNLINSKKNICNSPSINKSQSFLIQKNHKNCQTSQATSHKKQKEDYMSSHDQPQTCLHANLPIKPKRNPTTTLLNHSKNMIISKIKTEKNNLTPLHKKEKDLIASLKYYFVNNNKLDNVQKISNLVHKNYNQEPSQSKNKLSDKNKTFFENSKQNLTIEKLLGLTARVKSVEKKKYIEKINQYKVISKNSHLVSIYKNKENKNFNDQTVDLANLLCTPGYVGNYLYQSNSTNEKCENELANEQNHIKLTSEQNHIELANVQAKNEQLVKNDLQVTKCPNLNEPSKINNIHEECQIKNKINNQFLTNQNDEILFHMTKAINSSPTLNLDIQYITLFIELLKNQKKQNLIL